MENPIPKPQSMLQQLYGLIDVETVHAISGADRVNISVDIPGNPQCSLRMPAGHYLILRVVNAPMAKPGLYAVVAPKPETPAAHGNGEKP